MKNKNILIYCLLSAVSLAISFVHYMRGTYCLRFTWAANILIYALLCPIFLYYTQKLRENNTHRQRVSSVLLSIVLGFGMSVGKNYFEAYSWTHCFGNIRALALISAQTLIYSSLLYLVIITVFGWIDSYKVKPVEQTFDYWKWFWRLILVKTIFLIAYFPCIFDFDSALGLRTFLSPDSAICNHHPVFVQFVHAVFFKLGDALGWRSLGFASLSVIFIFFSSFIIIYCLKLVEKMGKNNRSITHLAAFFTFVPLFPYLSIVITKDGFFIHSLFLYILSLFELYITRGDCLKNQRFIIVHILSILLVCLTRHQGIYLIVIETLYILCYYSEVRIKLFVITVSSIALVLFINKVVYPYYDIERGGKQETLGIFFHQTAYYLTLYPDDVTKEELSAINAILNKDDLINRYESYTTDFDKVNYKYNPLYIEESTSLKSFHHLDYSDENRLLKNYMKAWMSMGKRHPKCYILATTSVFIGFLYNEGKTLVDLYTTGVEHPAASTPEYFFWRNDYLSFFYNDHCRLLAKIPIVCWFFAISYYIWFTLILLAILFYRKDFGGLSVFLPVLLSVLVLFVCPVASGRYALPIVYMLPFLWTYLIISNPKNLQTI